MTCSTSPTNENVDGRLFLVYYPIWKHLLSPKKQTQIVDYLTEEQWNSIQSLIYDELMESVIKFLQKLDLSYSTLESTNDQLKLNKPKDFELLLNLVEFCKLLFPSTHTDFFTRWIFVFGRELILRSAEFPLVSGIYKLLTITLRISETEKYFDILQSKLVDQVLFAMWNLKFKDKEDAMEIETGEHIELAKLSHTLFEKAPILFLNLTFSSLKRSS
jgi:hypothetical protein